MEFWQRFETIAPVPGAVTEPPARDRCIAPMPDGSGLTLPLRDLGDTAVAGFIANQAAFSVVERIAGWMAQIATAARPDIVAGLPTLGHVFAPLIARHLGHPNWVALGTTRKLWYDERLSVPLASITSPTTGRRLWLDPRLLSRIEGRRVLMVDDVISTGASARAGLAVLAAAGTPPVAMCVAMAQGDRWRAAWPADTQLLAAFTTPIFARAEGGWRAIAGTAAPDVCPLWSEAAQ